MKKMLVLVLILGMASLANAALTLTGPTTVQIGNTITLAISSDAVGDFGGYVEIDDPDLDIGTLGNAVVFAAAGDMASIDADADPGVYQGYSWTAATSPTGSADTGIWFTIDFTGDALGTANVWLYDSDLNVLDSLAVTVIPEPITMALLGLGGLFLRKRK